MRGKKIDRRRFLEMLAAMGVAVYLPGCSSGKDSGGETGGGDTSGDSEDTGTTKEKIGRAHV